jgi:hypothetical protein
MLKSGHDFAASSARHAQRGPRVLATWAFNYDAGDHHPTLNRPADSVFAVEDLRLRISLQGDDVRVAQIDAGKSGSPLYALSAGNWRAVIHTSGGTFLDQPFRWELGQSDDTVYVDAILHHGAARSIDFHTAALKLAFGLEVLRAGEAESVQTIASEPAEAGRLLWRWGDLQVVGPVMPTLFQW